MTSTWRVLLGAVVGLVVVTPIAQAKCGTIDAARLRVASARAVAAGTGPAATDAQLVVSSARKRCSTAAFAYALATATQSQPTPSAGTRIRVGAVDLVATALAAGVVWRFDAPRAASAHHPLFATTVGSSVTWSADPSRPSFDPQAQSAVLGVLSHRSDAPSRAAAAAGTRAFATRAHRSNGTNGRAEPADDRSATDTGRKGHR